MAIQINMSQLDATKILKTNMSAIDADNNGGLTVAEINEKLKDGSISSDLRNALYTYTLGMDTRTTNIFDRADMLSSGDKDGNITAYDLEYLAKFMADAPESNNNQMSQFDATNLILENIGDIDEDQSNGLSLYEISIKANDADISSELKEALNVFKENNALFNKADAFNNGQCDNNVTRFNLRMLSDSLNKGMVVNEMSVSEAGNLLENKFSLLDADNSGGFDYSEFQKIYFENDTISPELKEALSMISPATNNFQKVDTIRGGEQDNNITRADFRKMSEVNDFQTKEQKPDTVEGPTNEEKINAINLITDNETFSKMDTDHSGGLYYEEMTAMLEIDGISTELRQAIEMFTKDRSLFDQADNATNGGKLDNHAAKHDLQSLKRKLEQSA